MGLFSKLFTQKEQKQSAAASVIVGYQTGQPQWTGRDYVKFSEEAYKRNVIAHRCIKMIAEGCGSIQFTLQAQGKDASEEHPLLKLLNRPNPMMARSEFIEAVMSYRLVSGNSYIEAVSKADQGGIVVPDMMPPRELFTYRPDKMQIISAANGYPGEYRYTNGSQTVRFVVDSINGNSQILHLRNFNPLNHWLGLSPIEAAAYSIDQHNQAGAWNQALLQNGARPSGALIVKMDSNGSGTITDEQYNRLNAQLEEKYSSAKNAGRPMILEGGMEWHEMSLSPRDMDFLECKNSSARDIALAFGVPPMLLGIPGDNTYSNMQEARLALWEDTIIPLFRHLVGELNHWLAPRFGNGLVIGYDDDKILALVPRRKETWEMAQQADFLTINQKLEMTGYGSTPQDGGDVVLVDANKVPLADAGIAQLNNEPIPTPTKKAYLDMLIKCSVPENEAHELADRIYGKQE